MEVTSSDTNNHSSVNQPQENPSNFGITDFTSTYL